MSTSELPVNDRSSGRINQGVAALAASTVLLVATGVALGSFAILFGAMILASMYTVTNFLRGPSGI